MNIRYKRMEREFRRHDRKPKTQVKAEKKSLFDVDYFDRVKIEDVENNFVSHFTDDEVINLLTKVAHKHVVSATRDFENIRNTGAEKTNMLRYVLHKLAEKLLDRFGSKMLSFIYDLPNLNGTNHEIEAIYNPMTLNAIDIEFPSYKIEDSQFIIAFEEIYFESNIPVPYIVVCQTDGKLVSRITAEGFLADGFEENLNFNIFEVIKNGKKVLFGGVVNAFCYICNKPLTTPRSVYFGMGPTCMYKNT